MMPSMRTSISFGVLIKLLEFTENPPEFTTSDFGEFRINSSLVGSREIRG